MHTRAHAHRKCRTSLARVNAFARDLVERTGYRLQKLLVLQDYGHYEIYAEPTFREVMYATLDWYQTYLPARSSTPGGKL